MNALRRNKLARLFIRKALLLNALEDYRELLGMEGWQELTNRATKARTHRVLDSVALNLAEICLRNELRQEREEAA